MRTYYLRVLAILMFALVTGCASVNQKISLLYEPVGKARGGSGTIYLAGTGNNQHKNDLAENVRWVIGSVHDKEGSTIGEVSSPQSAEDILLDALREELQTAGYMVRRVEALPKDGSNGLQLTAYTFNFNKTKAMAKDTGECDISMSLNVFKDGALAKRLQVTYKMSDYAIIDRDFLMPTLGKKTLQKTIPKISAAVISVLGNQ